MNFLKNLTFSQILIFVCLFFVLVFRDWTCVAAMLFACALFTRETMEQRDREQTRIGTIENSVRFANQKIDTLHTKLDLVSKEREQLEKLAEETKALLSQTKLQSAFGRK